MSTVQKATYAIYAFELIYAAYIVSEKVNSWLGHPLTQPRVLFYGLPILIFLLSTAHKDDVRTLSIAKDLNNRDGQPYNIETAQEMLGERVTDMHKWVYETIGDDAWDDLQVDEMHTLGVESFVQLEYDGHTGVDFGLIGLLQGSTDEITLCLSEGAPLDSDIVQAALAEGFLENDPSTGVLLGRITCGKKMAKKHGADPKDWHSLSVGDSRWRILARAARKVYSSRT
jgi:hypothetical protein